MVIVSQSSLWSTENSMLANRLCRKTDEVYGGLRASWWYVFVSCAKLNIELDRQRGVVMSNSDLYNVVMAVGIVLALVLARWVKGQTRQVQGQTRRRQKNRQKPGRGHRAG